MNTIATLNLRKSTNPLFTTKMQIESWKPKEQLFIAKSSGYNDALESGRVHQITVKTSKGEDITRYAMTFNGEEVTAGNCTAIAETGEVIGNYYFSFSAKGLILKGSDVINEPFGVCEEPVAVTA